MSPRVTSASLGPYDILSLIGAGGGGEVYRAWDPRLERHVALKVLHRRAETDPVRVQRFIAEARAASALNHPNIVTVFDAAVDGDRRRTSFRSWSTAARCGTSSHAAPFR